MRLTPFEMRRCVEVEHLVARSRQNAHLAVIEIHHLARVLKNRRDVTRDVVLALAEPDEQRASLARADDLVRIAARDHRDAVGAFHEIQRVDDRVLELSVERRLDEMREHLRVRLRLELVPLHLEHLSQGAVSSR